MTVQTSKNPQVDIAEDNAFFPSERGITTSQLRGTPHKNSKAPFYGAFLL
ncbi:TPA: hypothetical protein SIG02_004424 [Escherichia coli]|nr:hypothetical protein [Escherichia coli]HEI0796873.1 hypothetical protein [Escherichia coli]HEI0806264.1 hypothetical protein [Escherichia coli]HEI0810815.1 hypothetical protein [Escherichia coli]HEI1170512.1 hypothetical protein [Escherichia coli]